MSIRCKLGIHRWVFVKIRRFRYRREAVYATFYICKRCLKKEHTVWSNGRGVE